jgi:hypothetical protein
MAGGRSNARNAEATLFASTADGSRNARIHQGVCKAGTGAIMMRASKKPRSWSGRRARGRAESALTGARRARMRAHAGHGCGHAGRGSGRSRPTRCSARAGHRLFRVRAGPTAIRPAPGFSRNLGQQTSGFYIGTVQEKQDRYLFFGFGNQKTASWMSRGYARLSPPRYPRPAVEYITLDRFSSCYPFFVHASSIFC